MVESALVEVRSVVCIDGPNIDGVLGAVLGRRPRAQDRPRWERLKSYLDQRLRITDKPIFVTNGRKFTDQVFPLRRALRSMGYRFEAARETGSAPGCSDPVDKFILDQLEICLSRVKRGEELLVGLASHDYIYAGLVEDILANGGSVAIIGFRDEFAPDLLRIECDTLELHDLEYDIGAFTAPLNRPYRPSNWVC